MIALALTGCVINGDEYPRPRDLVDDWMIDKTRLLAIRADPPEAKPGDVVTASALFASPPGDSPELTVVWLACPVDDSGNGFGCATDLGSVDLSNPDPAALQQLGLIGIEPGFPPTYSVPTDLLDDLDDHDKLEGKYVLLQALALPPDALSDPENLDFSEVVSGFKRLVVSTALTPNHNPEMAGFTMDGSPVPPGAIVHLDWHQPYDVGVTLADDAIESYEYVDSEGATEDRVEEPYVTWFTTGGQLLESVTLYPYLEASWISPPAPGQRSKYGGTTTDHGTWYAILRDRRGGMSWLSQDWVIDSP